MCITISGHICILEQRFNCSIVRFSWVTIDVITTVDDLRHQLWKRYNSRRDTLSIAVDSGDPYLATCTEYKESLTLVYLPPS